MRPRHHFRPIPTPFLLSLPPTRTAWNLMFLGLMEPNPLFGSSRSTISLITMPHPRRTACQSPLFTWMGMPWPGSSGWPVMVTSPPGQSSFRRCILGLPRLSTRIPPVPSINLHSVQQSLHTFPSSKILQIVLLVYHHRSSWAVLSQGWRWRYAGRSKPTSPLCWCRRRARRSCRRRSCWRPVSGAAPVPPLLSRPPPPAALVDSHTATPPSPSADSSTSNSEAIIPKRVSVTTGMGIMFHLWWTLPLRALMCLSNVPLNSWWGWPYPIGAPTWPAWHS